MVSTYKSCAEHPRNSFTADISTWRPPRKSEQRRCACLRSDSVVQAPRAPLTAVEAAMMQYPHRSGPSRRTHEAIMNEEMERHVDSKREEARAVAQVCGINHLCT